MARPAQWPDRENPWPAALSFSLHGAVLVAVLVLAAPSPVPSPLPPAVMVELIGMAGGGGAASPAGRSAGGEAGEVLSPVIPAMAPQPVVPVAEAAAVRPERTSTVRRPKRPPVPPSPTQETSSAAKSVASEATTGVTPSVTAAGDGQSDGAVESGAVGSGRGQARTGDGAGSAPDMDAYLAALRRAIQRGLVYPAVARRLGLAGLVRVRFQVLADGGVDPGSLVVTGGSDDDILRRGALDTIRRLSTFSPPPVGSIGVEVPVSFTLTQR
ncbi:TonB family protein [Magnetospirillum sp. 15-1]|uniref:energy transducer TonB n=1 Tax=Magnetospirillum sp. 15-1 TaxID=1979370 RepID=UPI000BBC74CD|nr:TonB family protein [Magnetospirillum sp. 15-1]